MSTMCSQSSGGMTARAALPPTPCRPALLPLGALSWHGSPLRQGGLKQHVGVLAVGEEVPVAQVADVPAEAALVSELAALVDDDLLVIVHTRLAAKLGHAIHQGGDLALVPVRHAGLAVRVTVAEHVQQLDHRVGSEALAALSEILDVRPVSLLVC